jgi:hypothetical protein
MNTTLSTALPITAIPDDDPTRRAAVARPDDDQTLAHWGVVGDTYTILISGEETAGRYTLIDMHVPTGGGPPPHRHDFGERRRDVQRPGQRAARLQEHLRAAGTVAVHVLTTWAGEVLRRGRYPRFDPHRSTTQAR